MNRENEDEYNLPQPNRIYEELDFDGDGDYEIKTIISWKDTVFCGPSRKSRTDQLLNILAKMRRLPTSSNILSRHIGIIVLKDYYNAICDSLHNTFDESPYVVMCRRKQNSQWFTFFDGNLIEVIRIDSEDQILRTRGKKFDEVFVVTPERFKYDSLLQIYVSCRSGRVYELGSPEYISDENKNFWRLNFKFPKALHFSEDEVL